MSMSFVHENFKRDHGILKSFGAATSDATFSYLGDDLTFAKLTKSWDTAGLQSLSNIHFDLHDFFELKFIPQSNRVGLTGDDTYYTIGITADKDPGALTQQTYGIYVEGGTIKLQNGPTIGDFGPVQVGGTYTLRLTPNGASQLKVFLHGPGIANPHLGNLDGPFLNRQVMFQFNCYSLDTIKFKDFVFSGSV